MIGTFLVQKRMSLIGDGIGHIAFAGVGAGFLAQSGVIAGLALGLGPVWMALVFAVAGSLGIEWLRSRRRASGDLALALFFYSGIALGVVLVSLGGGLNASVLTYLFGQPLTVSAQEVVLIVALGAAIVVAMWCCVAVLFAVVTDEDWSNVAGLPVGLVNNVLAVITAVAVVAAMQIVGILLIAAMMVLPVASGAIARALVHRDDAARRRHRAVSSSSGSPGASSSTSRRAARSCCPRRRCSRPSRSEAHRTEGPPAGGPLMEIHQEAAADTATGQRYTRTRRRLVEILSRAGRPISFPRSSEAGRTSAEPRLSEPRRVLIGRARPQGCLRRRFRPVRARRGV